MTASSDSNRGADRLQDFLSDLRKRGVMLWTENGTLRYRARKGALNAGDMTVLYRENAAIRSVLADAKARNESESAEMSRRVPSHAPLSFTQLAHWNFRLQAGKPVRQVALAIRLLGRVSLEVLAQSISEVVRRQWALRTRIVLVDGVPRQEITEGDFKLDVVDIGASSGASLEDEIQRQIECAILDAHDYASSPLFRAMLLKVYPYENVLILALDHIIADGISLNLLLEEISMAYGQCVRGEAIELPMIEVQFSDYASRQRAQPIALLESHRAMWASYHRTRFPHRLGLEAERYPRGWGVARISIEEDLWNEVRGWARRCRTTPVMAVLTAYAGLVLRWCNVDETIIQFMSDGRTAGDIKHTIGYFAFPLYLRVVLRPYHRFVDLLNAVTAEYCRSCDQPDFAFAHSQEPRPEFTRNTIFNWLPSAPIYPALARHGLGQSLSWSRIEFEHPLLKSLQLDLEPSVAVAETGNGLLAEVSYACEKFSAEAMVRFASNFKAFLNALVSAPDSCVREIEIT